MSAEAAAAGHIAMLEEHPEEPEQSFAAQGPDEASGQMFMIRNASA